MRRPVSSAERRAAHEKSKRASREHVSFRGLPSASQPALPPRLPRLDSVARRGSRPESKRFYQRATDHQHTTAIDDPANFIPPIVFSFFSRMHPVLPTRSTHQPKNQTYIFFSTKKRTLI